MKLNKESAVAVLVLIAIVVFIYQGCYLNFPRRDQMAYMSERSNFQSDWSWLTHSIDFNRTRLTYSGDYFLFRPGLNLFMALQDIFLRDQQAITGIFSIAIHSLVVILLYAVLRLHFTGSSAFLFAAVFASQYVGIEMVAWRHVSPYMIGIVFVLVGFLMIFSKAPPRYPIVIGILFCSTLFHEVVPVSFILLLAVLIFTKNFQGYPRLIPILAGALVLYFVLDVVNWLMTKPPSVLGSGDHFSLNWPLINTAAHNFFLYLGAGTRAVFAPFSMMLAWSRPDGYIFEFDITRDKIETYFAWAALAGMLLLAVGLISLRRVAARKGKPSDIISLWACCGLISLTVLFSFARMTLRGPGYCTTATYYYWFFSFFYMIILKFLIDEGAKRIPFVVYSLVVAVIVAQAYLAREVIGKNYNLADAKHLREETRVARMYLELHPEVCLDEEMKTIHPRELRLGSIPLYLIRYKCGRAQGAHTVHLVRNQDGTIRFASGPYNTSGQ